jgi:hypothetical protein
MAESRGKSRLQTVAELLARHGVEFIVIGGQAEVLHGGACVTYDIDLCYRCSADNAQLLTEALRELKPTLRDAPPDVPLVIDARSLALGSSFTFDTIAGPLDLTGWVDPIGDYDALAKSAQGVRIGEIDVKVLSLDNLIRVREHANTPKDRISRLHLLAIKHIQEEQK